jgi:hypothetical protein
MPEPVQPASPATNAMPERDEWVAEVRRLVAEAEEWSQRQGWAVRRDEKTITETGLGRYSVPVLLIQTPRGRLLLDPIARHIVGASGRIDLCGLPSYDPTPIVREADGWQFKSLEKEEYSRPWSEEAFVDLVGGLTEAA